MSLCLAILSLISSANAVIKYNLLINKEKMMNIKALLTALLIAVPVVSAYADDFDRDDQIEHSVRTDKHYSAYKKQAIAELKRQGYRVGKIEAGDHLGQGVFEVEAYKGKEKYDIKMSYSAKPKIIKTQRDYDD